jgi:hypothetical protein
MPLAPLMPGDVLLSAPLLRKLPASAVGAVLLLPPLLLVSSM